MADMVEKIADMVEKKVSVPNKIADLPHINWSDVESEIIAAFLENGDQNQILQTIKLNLTKDREIAEQNLLQNRKGTQCATRLSSQIDQVVGIAYKMASQYIYPSINRSSSERISIAAVGGYGRGTMALQSDVDILFILPYKKTAWCETVIEYILYLLWDLGLKVGHAVRSIDECLRMAMSDMTVRTAVLESRFLCGDRPLFDELEARFYTDVAQNSIPEFITDKLAERDERHKRVGDTRFLVEPNIKEGKGGQRDLHTLFWIAKYVHQVKSVKDLVSRGVFDTFEFKKFVKVEDFHWAVRCNLHFMVKRPTERLSFDVQQEIAHRLGYTDRGGLRGVERFMKHYFLVAKDVGYLTRFLCASFEVMYDRKSRGFGQLLTRGKQKNVIIDDNFVLLNGRVAFASNEEIEKDPLNILRVFKIAGEKGNLLHPDAFKLIIHSLKVIDKDFRKNPEANKIFMDILLHKPSMERIIRRMTESGVLGRFVPEFGKVTALMQFNMYHHYTVDEHTIMTMCELLDIMDGHFQEKLPYVSNILSEGLNERILFITLFLHDIAKGRKEDHSIAGERVARRLCPRFGLDPSETDTVAWLVRHHLLMSETAQSRDLSDPKTIRDFVAQVQSITRLKYLLVITVCDIRGVGKGVWNGWKGQLLRALYTESEILMSGGHNQQSRLEQLEHIKSELREVLIEQWDEEEITTYLDRHYPPYLMRVEPEEQRIHAQLVLSADQSGDVLAIEPNLRKFDGITDITIYCPDHAHLLSQIAGACTVMDANIVNAHIYTTRDGQALNTISISRLYERDEDEILRSNKICETIVKTISSQIYLPQQIEIKNKKKSRQKAFSIPAEVHISNDLSDKFTVIEAVGLDRPGLLYDLTSVLVELNLYIASAQITTYGEKAVDVFYVIDLLGGKIEQNKRKNEIKKRLQESLTPDQ